jgi:antitoxin HigA-1
MPTKLKPIHPGEILREAFMVPLRQDAATLAKALRVPVSQIADIANERSGITANMARRLARHFGTSVEFWNNLQADYKSRRRSRLAPIFRT